MRNRKLLLTTLAAMVCLGATIPASAGAAVSVPNGSYGPADARPSDPNVFGFKGRGRKLYDIRAAVMMSCRNTDTGATYDRTFVARRLGYSQGRTVPSNGTVRLSWRATDSLRTGTVSIQVTFRNGRSTLGSVDVASPATGGSVEDCEATWPFRMVRGPLR